MKLAFTPEADKQANESDLWWRANRPKAPGLFAAELAELGVALTVRGRRRVRTDGTLDVGGVTFETHAGFLSGKLVTVARSLLDVSKHPWIEHEDERYLLGPVNPEENARRKKEGRTDWQSSAARPRRALRSLGRPARCPPQTRAARRRRCPMSRFLSHFGLAEAPFSKEIADSDLWVPSSRSGAVWRGRRQDRARF